MWRPIRTGSRCPSHRSRWPGRHRCEPRCRVRTRVARHHRSCAQRRCFSGSLSSRAGSRSHVAARRGAAALSGTGAARSTGAAPSATRGTRRRSGGTTGSRANRRRRTRGGRGGGAGRALRAHSCGRRGAGSHSSTSLPASPLLSRSCPTQIDIFHTPTS